MRLQERIKADLKIAMKEKDEEKKNAIRITLGELGRIDKKEPSDDEVIQVLKKMIKSEKETLEAQGQTEDSRYIKVLEEYLPQMASAGEIQQWIEQNVDFSQFKNKMQAMKPIMAHFGASADGNTVKQILQKM